ncbi:MAG: ATP-dependent Clp protease adaptor ClpS [Phycisphaerae bacterium]|nr:ATP-dependent Clp protease adaptor ClpS [Phycisphaerae bacterium]NUQ44610.1 ATP-dependent Clp protease adaptor ClpS [Phycisphaerae bacterium]
MSDNAQKGSQQVDTRTEVAVATAPAPEQVEPRHLPQYRVILHNDDNNTFEHVILTIIQLTTLNETDAVQRTIEAHETGCALLLVTHKERAELYVEQFQSASLTVTIEPVE